MGYRIGPIVLLLLLVATGSGRANAQSVEIMTGSRGALFDLQFLKTLSADSELSVFARSRATVNFENQADLFSALYLSYTLPSGAGMTLLGQAQGGQAGGAAGLHFFHASQQLVAFGLVSAELRSDPGLSWFSLLRYRRPLNDSWEAYLGLEVFSLWREQGHVVSVQRVRVGTQVQDWGFGVAANLSQQSAPLAHTVNPGVFLRRSL